MKTETTTAQIIAAYEADRAAGIGHKAAWAKHAGKPGAKSAKNILDCRQGSQKARKTH